MTDPATPLAEVLLNRAEREPEETAYESVDPTGCVTALSHAQLASRASALADLIAAGGDGPVLLLYPAGLDYVVAIFAGFLAGRPVVPAYPLGTHSRPDRARLAGIVADARPSAVVAPAQDPDLPVTPVVAVPGPEADGAPWRRPPTGPGVAIVQYTSGSTGRPRGVLVRHDSIAWNTAAIADRFGIDRTTSRGLTWLPPFHDMGLVGGLLTPLAAGIPVRIMPPETFLKAPLAWLRQITISGATISGGPNFAYDLCVRRARTDDALAGLDLSGWRVAFNGGETIRHRTMAEFAARFAPVGFDQAAFLPCYGLAEATLIVSAGRWRGPAETAAAPVSCGPPVSGQHVAIVDPARGTRCEPGVEGEIWVAGEHVTAGYLSGDASGLFGELAGERFLRTGDRGYLRGGELVVTGRTKDVIVFRGVNHHAVDVEAAALEAVGDLGGAAAAFLVDDPDPLAVLIQEVRGRVDDGVASMVRAAVLARTGLPLNLVVLVPPRSVPRTSSGKVQRARCREMLLAGAYDGAFVDNRAALAVFADRRARSATTSDLAALICGVVAGVCDLADCRPSESLAEKGIDSVRAAETAAVLEDALGLTVPLEDVLFAPTPHGVADALVRRWLAADLAVGVVRDRIAMVANGGETA